MGLHRLIGKARRLYSILYKAHYHYAEKNWKGIRDLSRSQRKSVDLFWHPYTTRFNHRFISYYSAIRGTFSETYIPDDLWYNHILPHYTDSVLASKVDDKASYDLFLKQFTMPETVLRVIDGYLLDADFNRISKEEASRCLRAFPNGVIFKPAMNSSGGAGIKRVMPQMYDSLVEELSHCANAVVQDLATQSGNTAIFNPKCLNTVRISSLILDCGEVIFPSSMFRMGIRNMDVDNASSGGIFVGVDIATGRLKKYGYSRGTGQYTVHTKHPESGVIFEGYQIEGYEKMKQQIRENVKYLPRTRFIGWDFCFGENCEPILIEVNLEDHELECLQIANGPYFGEYTEQVLGEVFCR